MLFRSGVHAVGLEGGEADAHLAHLVVITAMGGGEMAVVENSDGDGGVEVQHVPGVLLVPLRHRRGEQRACAHPLLAVLDDAVRVGEAPLFILHAHQASRAEDVHLQDANGALAELLHR